MKPIVLIPARGGSKRIPFKNMKKLAGEPLINYTINFAKSFTKNDRIVVSSDDEDILNHSAGLGVQVLERPTAYSSDIAKTGTVLSHFSESGALKNEDCIITLQPTNPFRSLKDLVAATKVYRKYSNQSKSLCSISKMNLKYGQLKNSIYQPENYEIGQRSQDLSKKYFENGQFYITSLDLAREGKVLDNSPLGWVCNNWYDFIDIDEDHDFTIAAMLMEKMKL
ncbi:MAG: acylneuraminate cytidylyltransferase family protein [Bacteroidota bacterium]